MNNPQTAERNAAIAHEAAQGMRVVDLAKRYGLSRQRIQQIVHAASGKPAPKPQRKRPAKIRHYNPNSPDPIERRNAEIVRARQQGEASIYDLAKRYSISAERVRQIADRGGVDPIKAAAAYAKRKRDELLDGAEEHAPVILMRYIAGHSTQSTADALGLPATVVQTILDEQVTDDVVAARSANQTRALHPDSPVGPRDDHEPNAARYWTAERCMDALVKLARENGGLLPSSTEYQIIAPSSDDLPSFSTVRNRLGRWTHVRAEVHRRV